MSSKIENHARREHFVQRIHVAGDACYQAANRILIEERDVQPLQVTEDLAAQVEHHLLPSPLHDVCLCELKQKTEQQDADIHCGNLRNTGQRPRAKKAVKQGMSLGVAGEVFVDCNLGEIRPQHVGARLQHNRNKGDNNLQPIGMQIGQQALHQPAVICLT